MRRQIKNFYIFRHGESPLNANHLVQGRSDGYGLTPLGCRQAHLAGRRLRDKNIEIIISSPLQRAHETAKIIARHIISPIIFDERFIEVNVGVIEGLPYAEVEKRYADVYKRWRQCRLDDTDTRFEGGESKYEVRQRLFNALNHYAKKSPYINIAISGHGIILSQALLGLGINQPDIPNCAIIHLQYKNKPATWRFLGFVE